MARAFRPQTLSNPFSAKLPPGEGRQADIQAAGLPDMRRPPAAPGTRAAGTTRGAGALRPIAGRKRGSSASATHGNGNGGGITVLRFREGVERFMITDTNNPDVGAKSQSEVYIMFDSL